MAGKTIEAVLTVFPRIRDITSAALRGQVCHAWLGAWQASDYDHIADQTLFEQTTEEISSALHATPDCFYSVAMSGVVGRQ